MWRPPSYGGSTAEAIDHVVKDLIDKAFKTAFGILENNRPILEAAARELLDKETLGPEDLAKWRSELTLHGRPQPALTAAE
jgi:cell division protease FtsH